MKTSLYLPYTNFKINDENGENILFETLIQSGPAYKLVVHESLDWLRLKDKMPTVIEIISNKQAQKYIDLVNRFFSPIDEVSPIISDWENSDRKPYLMKAITAVLKLPLSYILLAYDNKARIYDDDFLNMFKDWRSWEGHLSNYLKQHKDDYSNEAIKRVEFVEKLMDGYQKDIVNTLSVNKDPRIFNDLMDLLDKEEIKILSEKNYLFGIINVKKDILKREINNITTKIIKNEWFPYLVSGTTLTLSYHYSMLELEPILSFLSGLSAKILSRFDFREYSPPAQYGEIFQLSKSFGSSILYQLFNQDSYYLNDKKIISTKIDSTIYSDGVAKQSG